MLRKLPSSKDGCLNKVVVCKLKLIAFVSQHTWTHLNTCCLFLQANSRLSFETSRHALSNLKLWKCATPSQSWLITKLDQNRLSLRRLALNLRPEELICNSWTVTAKHKGRKLNFSVLSTISGCRVGKFNWEVPTCTWVPYPIVRQARSRTWSSAVTCQLEYVLTDVEQGFLMLRWRLRTWKRIIRWPWEWNSVNYKALLTWLIIP